MRQTLHRRLERVEALRRPPKIVHVIWPKDWGEPDNPPETGEVAPGLFHWVDGAVPEWVEKTNAVRLRVVMDALPQPPEVHAKVEGLRLPETCWQGS
jgi:hypothetical protein